MSSVIVIGIRAYPTGVAHNQDPDWLVIYTDIYSIAWPAQSSVGALCYIYYTLNRGILLEQIWVEGVKGSF
jgi:hypothetical protein